MPEVNLHAAVAPPSFRASLLEPVMHLLRSGECCSIIGAGGVGKSNLARSLAASETRQRYWGEEAAWIVLIDCNALSIGDRPTVFVVLELIIHRLIREAERQGLDQEFVAGLDELHSRVIAQPDPLLALRYSERIIGRLLESQGLRRLVLLFDQFEDIWAHMDAQLFLNLRYLRDEFKYRLVFLTITRGRLQRVRQRTRNDLAAVESFWEIFDPHVFGLGMCNTDDARLVLERIASRNCGTVDDELVAAALALTGGHPALLRTMYWKYFSSSAALPTIDEIIAVPEIARECGKLWQDLLADEQQLVRTIASGGDPVEPGETLAELRLKELVCDEPPRLFSPIFHAYVQQHSATDASGVLVDRRQRLVWVDGRQLASRLAPLEFSLIEYLAERSGQVCTRDEILAALYPDDHVDSTDDRIDTLVRRLRESLGEDGRRPRYVLTVRGVGLQLAQGGIVG